MAGIGFVLRKLYRQENLYGLVGACMHSSFASAGPWLFTVLALSCIEIVGRKLVTLEVLFNFRVILIYNFCFSMIIAGPVYMIATRYLSDSIYRRDVATAPSMLFGALVLLWAAELAVAGAFYFLCVKLTTVMAISALINFLLVSAVWLVGIFIAALRNYLLVTRSFLYGMAIAILACTAAARPFGSVGMLNGFSLGLSVTIGFLLGHVLSQYPYDIKRPFRFLSYFRRYWEIALSGVIYNMAIWVDKWVMWFAPEATRMKSGFIVFPYYDSTMFISYMTTIPSMAMFLFSAETNFFEHYMRFYRDIEKKANFARIQSNHREIARSVFSSAGNFFLLQGSIAALGMLMAPQIVAYLKDSYLQIGMLRYGLLGSMFQILTFFLLILLSYFDNRKAVLLIQLIFLITNAGFTFASMKAGFTYYGFGYFMSAFITFIVTVVVIVQYVSHLPYHTFISRNTSIA
jgi:uncharacterized membrane protein